MDYNAEQLRPYVVHEDRFGNRDWLFDGFLFLEFDNGKGVSTSGATRHHWPVRRIGPGLPAGISRAARALRRSTTASLRLPRSWVNRRSATRW